MELVLNLDLISRISGHHILEISVYDKTAADSAIDNRTISSISAVDEAKEAAKAADDENTKYYETVRNSEEFKTFEEHYNEHIDTFKDDLKKLISSDDEVDTKSLVKNTIDYRLLSLTTHYSYLICFTLCVTLMTLHMSTL